ncbi:MAG: EamA family transporter [Saccharofermentans sp.]|nr:EamA family transporter [Saccharofermentans sp.]
MSWSLWWPIGLVVLSNVVYHICSKSIPNDFHPLAATALTYLVGAVFSFVLYQLINPKGSFFGEYKHLNWAPFVLGFAIVGLETGVMYMYRAGWDISVGQIVMSAILAIALIFVGLIVYHESINLSKIIGIAFCLVGLFFINR